MEYYNLFLDFLTKFGFPVVVTTYLLIRNDQRMNKMLDIQRDILHKIEEMR